MATILLQKNELDAGLLLLEGIDPQELGRRAYLFYAAKAEFYIKKGEMELALVCLDKAIGLISNEVELDFLKKKRGGIGFMT
jgi:hypothetical protein